MSEQPSNDTQPMEETQDVSPDEIAAAVDAAEDAVVEYDWRAPHRFTSEQVAGIDSFLRLTCRRISQSLTEMFAEQIQILSDSLSQHYGFRLAEESLGRNEYWVYVGDKDGNNDLHIGYVAFDPESAGKWVSRLLGAMAASLGEGESLSPLERDLLRDIAANIMETISGVVHRFSGKAIEIEGTTRRGDLEFHEDEGNAAYCKIAFSSPDNPELRVTLVLSSDFLGTMVGLAPPKSPSPGEARSIREMILGSMKRVPVRGCVWLGDGVLTIGDMLNIEPGDILFLDRGSAEPVDFLIQGRRILSGFPCLVGSYYGMEIVSQRPGEATSEQAPAAE
jgi:flagellar motor switch protein FliM